MIDGDCIFAAIEGHAERTAGIAETDAIHYMLYELGVDSGEAVQALGVLSEYRRAGIEVSTSNEAYSGGVLDGFVIGVRAAREEINRGLPT